MSLEADCSWRRLDAMVFRNLPGPPLPLHLIITSASNTVLASRPHVLSCNPNWTNLDLPCSSSPFTLSLLDSNNATIIKTVVDLSRVYFVASNIDELDCFDFMVLMFEFTDESGWYTTPEFSIELSARATKSTKQMKILATQAATARQIPFLTLQSAYYDALVSRKRLLTLKLEVTGLKNQIEAKTRQTAKAYPGLRSHDDIAITWKSLKRRHEVEQGLTEQSISVSKSVAVHQEDFHHILESHNKRVRELSTLSAAICEDLRRKELLMYARRLKMLAEVHVVFVSEKVLEGFKYLSSPQAGFERDVEVSTSLGYSALLLDTVASIMRAQLCNPIKFMGSRSCVSNDSGEFPLYAVGRNADKEKMESGIRLLVQDIVQVLELCGYSGGLTLPQAMDIVLNSLLRQERNCD